MSSNPVSYPGSLESSYRISSNEELLEALHPVPEFSNRDDIKPWIRDRLESRGINLVIERSDASKVVFKCKNLHRKASAPRLPQTKLVNGKSVTKRIRTSPEESCPFRLRVSYSVKHKNWAVNIIKHEHNHVLCSNFGEHRYSSTSSTPCSTTSKRSWTSAYTPASTSSPIMSMTNSPASSLTPASEHMEYDFEMRTNNKKQRLAYESPLSHEIDPLEKLSLPEDLSDLNDLYDNEVGLNHAPNAFENSLDFTQDFQNMNEPIKQETFDQINVYNSNMNINMNADRLFEQRFESQVSHIMEDHNILGKIYTNPMALETSVTITAPSQNNSSNNNNQVNHSHNQVNLNNVNSHHVPQNPHSFHNNEDGNDPLMYLLSSSNPSYSLEELENLDKAMGVDANDKFLMSMFTKM